MTEEEIAQLKADAEKARQLEAQLAAERAERERQQAMYQGQFDALSQYIHSATVGRQEPQGEEDEDTKRLRAQVEQAVTQSILPHAQAIHINNRNTQRELAKIKHGELFTRFEKEIEDLLNTYPPNVSGAPGAYDAAFQAVKAKHADTLIQEEVQRRIVEASQQTTRRGAISPPRNTPAPTRTAPQQTQQEEGAYAQLDDAQRDLLEDLGITQEDFNKYNDNEYTEDILGFNGRDAV